MEEVGRPDSGASGCSAEGAWRPVATEYDRGSPVSAPLSAPLSGTPALRAQRIRYIVARELGMEIFKVRNEDRLADDLHADSIDRADLAIELEKEFGIAINDEIAGAWKTVGDAIATVEQALGASR